MFFKTGPFETYVSAHFLRIGKSKFKEDEGLAQGHSAGKWGLTTTIVKIFVHSSTKTKRIYNAGIYGKQNEVEKTLLVLKREGESEREGEKATVTVRDGGSG